MSVPSNPVTPAEKVTLNVTVEALVGSAWPFALAMVAVGPLTVSFRRNVILLTNPTVIRSGDPLLSKSPAARYWPPGEFQPRLTLPGVVGWNVRLPVFL